MKNTAVFNSVWCYSIYGDDVVKYYAPMLGNISLAKRLGVGLVLHTNKQNEVRVNEYFSEFRDDIILLVHDSKCADNFPKILRFLTCNSVTSDFYFFKDTDSIVTTKEIEIMNTWMCSDKPVALIMRDHPLHIAPIMAGMFGVNKEFSQSMAKLAMDYFLERNPASSNTYSYDQDWLANKIYPAIVGNASVNTSFFFYSSEKVRRIKRDVEGDEFIGAQAYKKSSHKIENLDCYLRLYGDNLLSVPYFPRCAFLYGKVRPTLTAAYLLSVFKR